MGEAQALNGRRGAPHFSIRQLRWGVLEGPVVDDLVDESGRPVGTQQHPIRTACAHDDGLVGKPDLVTESHWSPREGHDGGLEAEAGLSAVIVVLVLGERLVRLRPRVIFGRRNPDGVSDHAAQADDPLVGKTRMVVTRSPCLRDLRHLETLHDMTGVRHAHLDVFAGNFGAFVHLKEPLAAESGVLGHLRDVVGLEIEPVLLVHVHGGTRSPRVGHDMHPQVRSHRESILGAHEEIKIAPILLGVRSLQRPESAL